MLGCVQYWCGWERKLFTGKCRAALAEAKKDAEEAQLMAETREEAFRAREAAADERAAAADGRARRWEKKADELGQALSHKVNQHAARSSPALCKICVILAEEKTKIYGEA